MTSTAEAPPRQGRSPDWNQLVGQALPQVGSWPTYQKLCEARAAYPEDLVLRGYIEIVRSIIIRDFLDAPKGLQAVPKLSAEFLTDFQRFNLNAQEGFLVSLIDGRLDLQKLLRLSPFDQFTTMFHLAKLEYQKAIMIPK
jgi:hypothetical protein